MSLCLFKMNHLMYSPNCKSLWIKVSAKLVNVKYKSKDINAHNNTVLYFLSTAGVFSSTIQEIE